MTALQIDQYVSRATMALERIARATESMSILLPQVHAITGTLVEGEPQLVRDIEFVAFEIESIEQLARRKLVTKLETRCLFP